MKYYKALERNVTALRDFSPNLRLTDNFTLGEMIATNHGETLLNKNYDDITVVEIFKLTQLCYVLELIRKFLGSTPVRVNSGFRNVLLNHIVNGAPRSDHLSGRAADIFVTKGKKLDDYLKKFLDLGVIRYYHWNSTYSLHISIY